MKYCILGADNRSVCLRNMYKDEGVKIVDYQDADIIIAPIPFSRDDVKISGEIINCDDLLNNLKGTKKVLFSGAMSNNIKEKIKDLDIKFYDLMELDHVAIQNAIPTAEGAISVAIQNTNFTIHNSNVLVLGFGRIGKVLTKMLHGMGANVYCEARKESDLAMIEALGYNSIDIKDLDNVLNKMDVIFNTIPVMMLNKNRLKNIKKECAIIDLASSPGGVDFIAARKLEKNVIWALALPAKVAPYTAAKYLKESIDKINSSSN